MLNVTKAEAMKPFRLKQDPPVRTQSVTDHPSLGSREAPLNSLRKRMNTPAPVSKMLD